MTLDGYKFKDHFIIVIKMCLHTYKKPVFKCMSKASCKEDLIKEKLQHVDRKIILRHTHN